MAKGRSYPISGQTWRDPQGTFRSDWTSAALIGSILFVAFLFPLAWAVGLLK